MNIFSLLFSFYLLGLPCLPCGDREECTVKASATILLATSQNKHTHETEHCTPFCTCSCCAASVEFHTIASFKIPKKVFPTTKYPVYNISFSSGVSSSIWQPPKLATLLY